MSKYFDLSEIERRLDEEFDEELASNPQALARETARFFERNGPREVGPCRGRRLAKLLRALVQQVERGG